MMHGKLIVNARAYVMRAERHLQAEIADCFRIFFFVFFLNNPVT
jgi:hypothetical protein